MVGLVFRGSFNTAEGTANMAALSPACPHRVRSRVQCGTCDDGNPKGELQSVIPALRQRQAPTAPALSSRCKGCCNWWTKCWLWWDFLFRLQCAVRSKAVSLTSVTRDWSPVLDLLPARLKMARLRGSGENNCGEMLCEDDPYSLCQFCHCSPLLTIHGRLPIAVYGTCRQGEEVVLFSGC